MSKLKKNVTSGLTRFTGLVVDHLSVLAGLDDEQKKGARNTIRDACRNGGTRTPGYYSKLPTGKGTEVQVTPEQEQAAYDQCVAVLTSLIPVMAAHGEGTGEYSYTDKATKAQMSESVTFDCSAFAMPDDATIQSWIDSSKAGAQGGNTFLAALDF